MKNWFMVVLQYLVAFSPVLIIVGYGLWAHWYPYRYQKREHAEHLARIHKLIEMAKQEERK